MAAASAHHPSVGSLKMSYVTAKRELLVHTGSPADVLLRVRDGLVRRGRRIDPGSQEGIRFRGGWALAWRTSKKPIRGLVQVERRDDGAIVQISIHDAAIGSQVAMFGFERRQYEAVIDRELNEIQLDVERGDALPDVAQARAR
jgi:hypothetical protein